MNKIFNSKSYTSSPFRTLNKLETGFHAQHNAHKSLPQ